VKRLHIISYLAPSVPAEFFRVIANDLDATLEFNEAIADALLTLHERHSLAPFGFERFVAADERLYK
jgi:hypothetical protein